MNRKSYGRTSHQPRFYAAPNFLKMNGDKLPKFVVFRTISTIQDEETAAKFHYIKTVIGKVVVQSITFRVDQWNQYIDRRTTPSP